MAKSNDFEEYKYFGYIIGFDACGGFSFFYSSGFGKTVILFDDDMNSSVRVDKRKKDIFILRKKQELHDITLNAEAQYSINFIEHKKKIV